MEYEITDLKGFMEFAAGFEMEEIGKVTKEGGRTVQWQDESDNMMVERRSAEGTREFNYMIWGKRSFDKNGFFQKTERRLNNREAGPNFKSSDFGLRERVVFFHLLGPRREEEFMKIIAGG